MESKVEELEKTVALKAIRVSMRFTWLLCLLWPSQETANRKLVTSIHKLEGDVQSLRRSL